MNHIALRIATLLGLAALWLLAAGSALADMTYKASDGEPVYATLSKAQKPGRAIALLFHQAGANRHEYDAIAPRLNAMGFATLALDQRSGGAKFGGDNKTVAERGESGAYLDAYADLEGAVKWAQDQNYSTIVAVGSSYAASLALQLAADAGNALTAVAVFSPGEYFDDKDRIKDAVAKIEIPFYITAAPGEQERVDEVLEGADESRVTRYTPENGVHGASTLAPDRDPDGAKANWQDFSAFMARFAPAG